MKILVAGSRSIKEFDLEPYMPKNAELIISGGASGIDDIAEKYADSHSISKLILRPNYRLFGKGAPLKRNEKMVDIADKIIAIWDGKSKGTYYTVKYAERTGKEVEIIMPAVTQA